MNRGGLFLFIRCTGIAILLVAFSCLSSAVAAPLNGKASKKSVGLVLFAAHDCPRCENVKDLIKILKGRYALRVKDFDVDRTVDYALFKRVEAIHATDKFAVPLVLVGDSILMGEEEITKKLEKTVGDLAKSGGAPFPYLGSTQGKNSGIVKPASSPCNCDQAGRPPDVSDELSKLRKFIEKLF